MSTMDIWIQDDWSGGENTLLSPELIADNEAVKIVNMLPNRNSAGLSLRKGFKTLYADIGDEVFGIFVKRRKNGTKRLIAAVGDGAVVKLKDLGEVNPSNGLPRTSNLIYTFSTPAKSFKDIWFCDWDADRFFFSTATEGLFTYDFNTVERVTDAVSSTKMNGSYIIQHKGRLVSSEPNSSTLHICGSDDSVNPRWKSWYGSSASSGGSVDVIPYGSSIKALVSTYGGIVVMKEDSIHLWSYSESAAPWDAVNASIEVLSSGVGCVNHHSVAFDGNTIYFIGRSDAGNIGLYLLSGTEVSEVSNKIPSTIKKIINSGGLMDKVFGSIVDDYYVLVARSGSGGKTVVAMMDIKTGAWVSCTSPKISAIHRSVGEPYILLGGYDGAVYKYPSDSYTDGISTAIPWEVVSRRIVSSEGESESHYRNSWIDASAIIPTTINYKLTLDNGTVLSCESQVAEPTATNKWSSLYDVTPKTRFWNDGSKWETPTREAKYYIELGARGYGATYHLSGEASGEFSLNRVGIGFRQRRVRNVRGA